MGDDSERRDDAAQPTADAAAPVEESDTQATAAVVDKAEAVVDKAEADEADARSKEIEPPRRRLRKPRLTTALAGTAIVSVCALLGVSGYIVVQHRSAVQRRERVAEFIAAAKQGVINMTSLDFHHAEGDIQRVLDSSTGEFKDDFERQAADFIAVAKQGQVISEGAVNLAAVESMDKDSAVVLVAATSHVTNFAGAKEDPRTWRLRVTVSKDGDQLKMSKLVYVP